MAEFAASSDGAKIAYEIGGRGSPVILAHGASGDRQKYPALRTALSEDFTLISYDRRGRGESQDGPAYNLLVEADDLRAVASAVSEVTGARPVVFGISMGGRIALELLRDPPTLKAIAAFEAPIADHAEAVFADRLAQVRQTLETDGPAAAAARHAAIFNRRSPEEIEELKRDARGWKTRTDSISVTLREMEAVHRDLMFDPANYPRPDFEVHTLFGDATLPFLIESGRLWDKLGFIKRHTLEGMAHSAPDKNPEIVYKAFRAATDGT